MIEVGAEHACIFQVTAGQAGVAERGLEKVDAAQIAVSHDRFQKIGLPGRYIEHEGPDEHGPAEIGMVKYRTGHAATGQTGPLPAGAGEVSP